jgi:hypothetical protein
LRGGGGFSHEVSLFSHFIPWVGQVERKRDGGKSEIVVGEYQWVVGFSEDMSGQ